MEGPHTRSRSSSIDDSLNDPPPSSACDHPKSTVPPDPAASNFQQQQGSGGSESSAQVHALAGSSNSISEGKCHHVVEDDVAMALRRKLNDCGLGDTTAGVPQPVKTLHSNEDCAESSDEGLSDDDDLCSCSDSSDGSGAEEFQGRNVNAAGVMPPVLPDVQLRVPMDDANDVRRVKDALWIKGVLDVVCDVQTQTVTITGTVAPLRLLRKARQLKPQARIISTFSPFSVFINPNHFRSSSFPQVRDEEEPNSTLTSPIDIPSAHPGIVPNFVVHQRRPRPTFQRYSFHNDPHSPYLRTFSPTNLSPENSPSQTTGDVFGHHIRVDSEFSEDDDGLFIL